ncbi:putative T7SS-secreted protein [Streptomyces sp. NPDC050147]|uniref:putative T7SS-secreted protein n=1 Tax=Streptomyces sp. NPDC050147 TaxID=3155513 RepID=UPI003417B5F3
MSRRPTDWTPLYDSDPVPGDPYEVARLGRKLRGMAEEIDKQARNIKALASVESWDSDAGRAFHEVAGDTAGRLKKAFDRYDEAADALGTKVREGESKEYASELHRAQRMADKALEEFRKAEVEQKAAMKELEKTKGTVPSSEKDGAERTKQQKKQDDATSVMAQHRQKIMNAVEIRDDAADAAAKKIKTVIHHDGVRDPGGFMNWIADHADWFTAAATVLAVVALVAAVVLTGPFAAALLVGLASALSATALAGRLYDVFARGGKFDAMAITIDVLGVIPGLGVLKGVTAAAKGARFATAGKTVWGMFTNGMAVKGINKGAGIASKLLGKWGSKIPGGSALGSKIPAGGWNPENVTRVIKAAALTNLGVHSILKVARIQPDSGEPEPLTPDHGPGARPQPTPSPPSEHSTPSPSPRPSPSPTSAPFHGALAPTG